MLVHHPRIHRVVDKKFSGFETETSKGVLAITSINLSNGSILEIEEVVNQIVRNMQ